MSKNDALVVLELILLEIQRKLVLLLFQLLNLCLFLLLNPFVPFLPSYQLPVDPFILLLKEPLLDENLLHLSFFLFQLCLQFLLLQQIIVEQILHFSVLGLPDSSFVYFFAVDSLDCSAQLLVDRIQLLVLLP